MSKEEEDKAIEGFVVIDSPTDPDMVDKLQFRKIINERVQFKLQVEWYKEWYGLLTNPLLTRGRREGDRPFPIIFPELEGQAIRELERHEIGFKNVWQNLQLQSVLVNQMNKLYKRFIGERMAPGSSNKSECPGQPDQNEDYLGEMKAAMNRLFETEQHVMKMTEELSKMQNLYKDTRIKLEKVTKEKDNALTRLSQFAGDKLKHNNSDLTDLSDRNRPTNLAEKFNELYDNEWTDAFDHLTTEKTKSSETAIHDLLTLLQEAYKECGEIALSQRRELFNALLLLDNTDSMAQDKESINGSYRNLLVHTKRQILELQKSTAAHTVLFLKKHLKEKIKGPKENVDVHHEHSSPYLDKCIELCWYMNIQEKPVVLHFDFEKAGRFSTDIFRHYTKTGSTYDFLVWPSMFLYKDGPLLQKGVMQPQ